MCRKFMDDKPLHSHSVFGVHHGQVLSLVHIHCLNVVSEGVAGNDFAIVR